MSDASTDRREGGTTIAVLGLGNVLQRDDAVGPTVARRLAAAFEFIPEIRLEDLGAPGLHLGPLLAGHEAVIFVDTVLEDLPPGTVRVYGLDELAAHGSPRRLGPHDPGLVEAIAQLELAGQPPAEVRVVGVVPEDTGSGVALSRTIEKALPRVEAAVLAELERLGVRTVPKRPAVPPDLWGTREEPPVETD